MVISETMQSLPIYLLITLFFSYLVWAKLVQKKNKLWPQNIDELMKILSIFFIVLPSILGLSALILFLSQIAQMSLNLGTLWDSAKLSVLFMSLILIYLFISSYTGKKTNYEDLQNLLLFFLRIPTAFILLVLSMLLHLWLKGFYHLIPYIVLVMVALLVIQLLILILAIKNFHMNFKQFLDKVGCFVLLGGFFAFFILYNFGLPSISMEQVEDVGYKLYGTDPEYDSAFKEKIVRFNIKGHHAFVAVPQFVLPYKKYNFTFADEAESNFKLRVNSTNNDDYDTFIDSLDDIEEYESSDMQYAINKMVKSDKNIIMKFDKKKLNSERIQDIQMKGYVKQNYSALNFSYWDNSQYRNVCNKMGCNLTIKISNQLDLPVNLERDTFLNFDNKDVQNETNCNFVKRNITYSLPNKTVIESVSSCKAEHCNTILAEKGSDKRIFELILNINDGLIYRGDTKIKKPMNVSVDIKVQCD